MPMGRPQAERVVDEALARRLLEDQHPDLADLPLTHLDSGWDNVIYRLGDKLTVRLPRREVAAAVEGEVLVDLVGQGHEIVIATDGSDDFQLLPGEDLSRGVVGRTTDLQGDL